MSRTRIRFDRVAKAREAIKDGTYETPEKMERVVDRLLPVLQARINLPRASLRLVIRDPDGEVLGSE